MIWIPAFAGMTKRTMHPVLEHTLARKNKKVPVKDGRKIALVLYGGLMTGITAAGALKALSEIGLKDSFDAIYTISGSFGAASAFLLGKSSQALNMYCNDLLHEKFINWLRVWKIVDVKFILKTVKNKFKHKDFVKLFKHPTKLFVGVYNQTKKDTEYLEIHRYQPRTYLKLLHAAICLPYFSPGSVKIGSNRYKDYPLWEKIQEEHLNRVLSHDDYTDVLVIYNYHGQIKKGPMPSKRLYIVSPRKTWNISHFEHNSEKLKQTARLVGRIVKHIFGFNSGIKI